MRKFSRKLGLCVAFQWLLVSQVWAADTTVIAAFGDSLFSGYGLSAIDALPNQLEHKLKADGYNVTVINNGITGDTTAGGVSRVDAVIAQQPKLVLVELGANDLLRMVPPQETRKNLTTILEKLKQAGIKVLLLGMRAPGTLGLQYAESYNTIFPEVAHIYGAVLYPFFFEGIYGSQQYMQEDGLHPSREGVAKVVGNIAPIVANILKK